jgi:hypothetical protein
VNHIDALIRSKRWTVLLPGTMATVVPAALLAAAYASRGHFLTTVISCCEELLIGPLKYRIAPLVGNPNQYAIHPMDGYAIWVYLTCLILVFAHPIRPNLFTGCVSAAGFIAWYGFAAMRFIAFEF